MNSSLSILSPALDLLNEQLQHFATSPEFVANMLLAFGESHDYSEFGQIFIEGDRTGVLNLIEVVPSSSLNGANGAFSRDTNKIYLASEYVTSASVTSLSKLLLEEYGHYIDAQLNPVETVGDEGEIFADLVQGNPIDPAAFTEDDTATITLNGTPITIEQGSPIVYVRQGATGTNNGTSWTNAYTDLQSALQNASAGSEIWVSAGTYYPTTGIDRAISFQLTKLIEVYGGFAGSETQRAQRNVSANRTILSGDIGIRGQVNDNSYHVVSASNNVSNATVLDGFTITDGNANDRSINDGAGIYNVDSNATFANLTISNNTASDNGGGIYSEDSQSRFSNITINNNRASDGGGIYNFSSNVSLIGMYFADNAASNSGGGIYNYSSNPGLTNITFFRNSATDDGGGINNNTSSPGLTNIIFRENTAGDTGGGMRSGGSSTLINVVFDRNRANTNGGGGLYIFGSSAIITITNSTFSNNEAQVAGGAIRVASGQLTITNSILWGNQAPRNSQIDSANAVVSYSLVQGGFTGFNNINADPLFVNAGAGDFSLRRGSLALNAGNNAAIPNGITTDIVGTPRILQGTVDLGAYESLPFDPAQYGASNPELIQAFGYNLPALEEHYYNYGRSEGRSPDSFDEFRYLASNPGLIPVFGTNGAAATEHFIRYGWAEGRSTTAFDPAQYLASHADLRNAYVDANLGKYDLLGATLHYIQYGFPSEGRATDTFDEARYIASHDDLIRAYGYNLNNGTNHYNLYGAKEGRNPLIFNPAIYLASHRDLIQYVNRQFANPSTGSFVNNYNSVLDFASFHFITSGLTERRSRGGFDPNAYLNRNTDLRDVFGADLLAATRHFIEFGFEEGRV